MDDTQLLLSRIDDLIEDYYYGKTSFIGFLNESELSVCCRYLKNRYIEFSVFGGYPDSTRAYLFLGADFDKENVPIRTLSIESTSQNELTHRDYLGSLMGLGIKRECIGDILILKKGQALVFVREEIADYIKSELKSVRRDSVKVSDYELDTSNFTVKKDEVTFTISSLRVDNIVSSLARCSRSEAVALIEDDKVFVNHLSIKKPSANISEDDIISIRGIGKFIYKGISGTTRKGNLIISVLHYI